MRALYAHGHRDRGTERLMGIVSQTEMQRVLETEARRDREVVSYRLSSIETGFGKERASGPICPGP